MRLTTLRIDAIAARQDEFVDLEAPTGALSWNVTDRLRGTVGLRWTEVDKDLVWTQTVCRVTAGDPRACAHDFTLDGFPNFGKFNSPAREFSRSDDDLNPSVNVQYELLPEAMVYFSFAQGFKAGGFDQRADRAEDIDFGPEEVDTYELGAKTTWLDGSLHLNLALFRSEYTDLQVSSLSPSGVSFIVTNAAEATSQGVELDLRWALPRGFTLGAGVSFLDGEFDSFEDGPCNAVEEVSIPECASPPPGQQPTRDRSGGGLPFAPEWSGNLRLSHVHHFANGLRLDSRLTAYFSTEVLHRIDNDPRLVEEGYAKLDARVALSRGPWELAVVGRNLTDETSFNLTNRLVGSGSSVYRQRDRDRHVLLQVGYAWE